MYDQTDHSHLPADISAAEAATLASHEDFVHRIQTTWQKRTSSIFAVAEACHEANKQLNKKQKTKLYETLPFSKPTFIKLSQIGGDSRIPGIADRLPASFSIIYEITLLSTEELELAVASGTIHPKIQRADIIKLRAPLQAVAKGANKGRDTQKPGVPIVQAGKLYQLRMPESVDENERDRIGKMFARLAKTFRIEIEPAEVAVFENIPARPFHR
jgi:hypothetical protein